MNLTAVITEEALEDDSPMFVALCPELTIVSQGETVTLAVANLREAVEGFLAVADAAEIRDSMHRVVTVQPLAVEAIQIAA